MNLVPQEEFPLANPEIRGEYFKLQAEGQRIRLEWEQLKKPLTMQLAKTIEALQGVQITMVNRPAYTAKLSQITMDAEVILRKASKLLADEQVLLDPMLDRANDPRI